MMCAHTGSLKKNNKLKAYFQLVTNLVRLLIEWIVLLVTSLYSDSRLIFNLNSNLYDKDNLNCKESEVDDANLSSMETEPRVKLNPWFVTGFCDAESSFCVKFHQNKKLKFGFQVQPCFLINLHSKDKALLETIQSYFSVGKLDKNDSESIQFRVSSIKELEVIINHFDKYPLITHKWSDYELFKIVFLKIKTKEHLELEGFKQLVAIRASINWGLSDKLKAAFLNIKPVKRPIIKDQSIPDPNWLAGFTSGEGCFIVKIKKSPLSRLGESVELRFQITQHSHDEQLINTFVKYFECGKYYLRSKDKPTQAGDFVVQRYSDIEEKIIPFFNKYPILGSKSEDFKDFKVVATLIKNKEHLIKEGLLQIKNIKAGMNSGRKLK